MTKHDQLLNLRGAKSPDLEGASLLNRAPSALSTDPRTAEIDQSYGVYDALPLDVGDEWGSIAAFLDAVERA